MATKKSEGLGDTIEKITKATGIKKVVETLFDDCGCDKRKEALNKMFPYKKVECLTEEEYEYLNNFDWTIRFLTPNIQAELLAIYNRVFNERKKKTTCTACWLGYIEKLKTIYDEYKKE